MYSNFFVSADTESSDCITCLLLETMNESFYLAVDGCLTTQLFQYFGSSGQSVTRLSNGNVENELLDFDVPHGV